jgi:uncharacterized protein (DUF2147 family)
VRVQLSCISLLVTLTAASPPNAASVSGHWRTQMQGAVVEVKTCSNHAPCAFLVWVDPALAQGTNRDLRNPDPALRSRPLAGLPIVWGLRSSQAGWTGGRVYNPETGQTFRSSMHPLPDGKLKVTGCWGPLCRSEVWVRASNPLENGN